jgi:hypothetical protein
MNLSCGHAIAGILAAGLLLLQGVEAVAQETPEKTTGLAIGTRAPEFTLKDQSNQERSLNELLKKSSVALVFHRSADW